jgi:DNA-binding XRE family transcriptional regulator
MNNDMSIGIRYSITSGQCRAARALLDITQPELAEAAGLGLSTIVDFEKSRRDVSVPPSTRWRGLWKRQGFSSLQRTAGPRRCIPSLKAALSGEAQC